MSRRCINDFGSLTTFPHDLTKRERQAASPEGPYFYIVHLHDTQGKMNFDKVFGSDEEGDLWAIVSQPHARIIYLGTKNRVEQWKFDMRTQAGKALGYDTDHWKVYFLEATPKPFNAPALADILVTLLYWGITPEEIIDFLEYILNEPEGSGGSYRPTIDLEKFPTYYLREPKIENGYYRKMMRKLVSEIADQLYAYPQKLPDTFFFTVTASNPYHDTWFHKKLPRVPANDLLMPLYGYQPNATQNQWSKLYDESTARKLTQRSHRQEIMERPPPNGASPFSNLPMDALTEIGQYLDNHDASAMQITSSIYTKKIPRNDEISVNWIPEVIQSATNPGMEVSAESVARVAYLMSRTPSIHFTSSVYSNGESVPLSLESVTLLEAAMDVVVKLGKAHTITTLEFSFGWQQLEVDEGDKRLEILLVKALAIFTEVKYFSLSCYQKELSDAFLEQVGKLIQKNRTIHSLNLSGGMYSVTSFGRLFLDRETNLRSLEISCSTEENAQQEQENIATDVIGKLIAKNADSLVALRLDWTVPVRKEDLQDIYRALLLCRSLRALRILRVYVPIPILTQIIIQNASKLQKLAIFLSHPDQTRLDEDTLENELNVPLMKIAESIRSCRVLRRLKLTSNLEDALRNPVFLDALTDSIVSLPWLSNLCMLPDYMLGLRNVVRLLNHASTQAHLAVPVVTQVSYKIEEVPALVVYRAAIQTQKEFIRQDRPFNQCRTRIRLHRLIGMNSLYRDDIFESQVAENKAIWRRMNGFSI